MNIKHIILLILIAVLCLLYSCLSIIPPGKIYANEVIPGHSYYGFTVKCPEKYYLWYWNRWWSDPNNTFILHREIPENNNFSKHTFYIYATLVEFKRHAESQEDFIELSKEYLTRIGNKKRFTLKHFEAKPSLRQGQWCVEYSSTIRDKREEDSFVVDLIVKTKGFIMIHPGFDEPVCLNAYYSERGIPEQLSAEYDEEGEAFLSGVKAVSSYSLVIK